MFEGYFENRELIDINGYGVDFNYHDDVKVGEFRHEKRKIYSEDGKAEGYEFLYNSKHGYGVCFFPNGIRYEGLWENNNWQG